MQNDPPRYSIRFDVNMTAEPDEIGGNIIHHYRAFLGPFVGTGLTPGDALEELRAKVLQQIGNPLVEVNLR